MELTRGQVWYGRIMGSIVTLGTLGLILWRFVVGNGLTWQEMAFIGGVFLVGCILGAPRIIVPVLKYIFDGLRSRWSK